MYKKRTLEEHIKKLSTQFKVILVTGARQVGKSTLLKSLRVPIASFSANCDFNIETSLLRFSNVCACFSDSDNVLSYASLNFDNLSFSSGFNPSNANNSFSALFFAELRIPAECLSNSSLLEKDL